MAKQERKRLSLNLDKLLPGEAFQIGDEQVIIRPLGLRQIREITSKLKSLWKSLTEQGVTFSTTNKEIKDEAGNVNYIGIPPNFKEPEKLLIIAEVLVTQFIDVLEEVSDIHRDDLSEFPIDIIVGLIDKCIDVNLKSKDSLLGNFVSLTGKLTKMGLLEKTSVKQEETEGQKK